MVSNKEDNYGSALLVLDYAKEKGIPLSFSSDPIVLSQYGYLKSSIETELKTFNEILSLSQIYGRLDPEPTPDELLKRIENWKKESDETLNYGWLFKCLKGLTEYIQSGGEKRKQYILEKAQFLKESFPEKGEFAQEWDQFYNFLSKRNFTAAEDVLTRIGADRHIVVESFQNHYFQDFLDNYSLLCRSLPIESLSDVFPKDSSLSEEDSKWAEALIMNWPKATTKTKSINIQELLSNLGFPKLKEITEKSSRDFPSLAPRESLFYIKTDLRSNRTRSSYKHPISLFGSDLDYEGMYIYCLPEYCSVDRIFQKVKDLETSTPVLVLHDRIVNILERRKLAYDFKQDREVPPCLVLDQVGLFYLLRYGNRNVVNQMLIALTTPLSSINPFTPQAANLRPEM
ncbi:MAG: hypothetical protein K2H85_10265, partial [Allobaculum sp.]|nr:hypothetical protein [Allobaculum sp.]